MAIDTHATAADEARAALAELDTAEAEMRRVRAHLERVIAEPDNPGITHQARRCVAALAAAVDTAAQHTAEAGRLADIASSDTQLRSVS